MLINSKRRPERLQHMLELTRQLPMLGRVQVFEAIDGKLLGEDGLRKYAAEQLRIDKEVIPATDRGGRPSSVAGTLLSHLSVWVDFLERSEAQFLLVLEDDLFMPTGVEDTKAALWELEGVEFDIVWLEHHFASANSHGSGRYKRVDFNGGHIFGTGASAFSREAVRRLVAAVRDEPNIAADHYQQRLRIFSSSKRPLVTLIAQPAVLHQDFWTFESDNREPLFLEVDLLLLQLDDPSLDADTLSSLLHRLARELRSLPAVDAMAIERWIKLLYPGAYKEVFSMLSQSALSVAMVPHPSKMRKTSNLYHLTYFRLEYNGERPIEPRPAHTHPLTEICLLVQGSLHYTVGTSLASLTGIDRHAPSMVIVPSGTAHTSRHFPGVNATEHCLKLVFRGAPASQLDVRDRPDQHDLEAVHYSLAANWSSQVEPAGFGGLLVDRFLIDHPVDGGFVTVKVVNMGQHVRPLVPPDVPRRHLHEVWLVVMNGEVLYEHNNDEITVLTQGQVAFVPAWQRHLFYCEKPCQFVKVELEKANEVEVADGKMVEAGVGGASNQDGIKESVASSTQQPPKQDQIHIPSSAPPAVSASPRAEAGAKRVKYHFVDGKTVEAGVGWASNEDATKDLSVSSSNQQPPKQDHLHIPSASVPAAEAGATRVKYRFVDGKMVEAGVGWASNEDGIKESLTSSTQQLPKQDYLRTTYSSSPAVVAAFPRAEAGAKRVKYRFVDGKMVEAGVGWASNEDGIKQSLSSSIQQPLKHDDLRKIHTTVPAVVASFPMAGLAAEAGARRVKYRFVDGKMVEAGMGWASNEDTLSSRASVFSSFPSEQISTGGVDSLDVVAINLKRHRKRRKHIEELYSALGWGRARFHDALDAYELGKEGLRRVAAELGVGTPLTFASVGGGNPITEKSLLLSNLQILLSFLPSDRRVLLVLEDDVALRCTESLPLCRAAFQAELLQMQRRPEQYDIAYLEHAWFNQEHISLNGSTRVKTIHVRGGKADIVGAAAILYSRHGAEKYVRLARMYPNLSHDFIVGLIVMDPSAVSLLAHPPLFEQDFIAFRSSQRSALDSAFLLSKRAKSEPLHQALRTLCGALAICHEQVNTEEIKADTCTTEMASSIASELAALHSPSLYGQDASLLSLAQKQIHTKIYISAVAAHRSAQSQFSSEMDIESVSLLRKLTAACVALIKGTAPISGSSDSSVLEDWERDQEYYDTGIYGPVPYAHSLFAQETIEEQRRFQNTEPWKLGLPLPLDKKASFLFGPYLRTHAANLVPLARRLIPADCEDLSLFGTSVVETYSGQQHGLHSDREQSDCQPGYGISFWMGLENVSETTTISILPRSGRRYKERCTAHFERGCDVPAGESLRTGPVRDGELIAWTDSTWHESRNTDVHGRAALLVQFNCPSRCSGPIRYPVFVSGKEELGEVWAPDLRVEDLLSERARRPLSSVPAGTFQALDLPWIRNASIVPSVTEVERDWVFLPPPSQPVLSQSVVFDSADLLSTTPAWVADSGSVTCYGTPSLSDQRTSNLQYLTYFRLEWNGAHSIAIEPHPVHVHPSTQICLLTQGSLHYTVGTSLASLTAIDRHAPSIVILPSGTAHTSRHFPGVNATEHCLKLVFRGAPASQLDVRDRPDQHDLEAVHYSLAANWSSQVDPAGFGELLVDRFLIDHPVDGGFVTVKVVNMGQHVRPLVPPDVPRRHLHEVWLVVMNGEVLYEHNNDEITVVTQGQVAFVPAWQWHLFYCEKPCQFVKVELEKANEVEVADGKMVEAGVGGVSNQDGIMESVASSTQQPPKQDQIHIPSSAPPAVSASPRAEAGAKRVKYHFVDGKMVEAGVGWASNEDATKDLSVSSGNQQPPKQDHLHIPSASVPAAEAGATRVKYRFVDGKMVEAGVGWASNEDGIKESLTSSTQQLPKQDYLRTTYSSSPAVVAAFPRAEAGAKRVKYRFVDGKMVEAGVGWASNEDGIKESLSSSIQQPLKQDDLRKIHTTVPAVVASFPRAEAGARRVKYRFVDGKMVEAGVGWASNDDGIKESVASSTEKPPKQNDLHSASAPPAVVASSPSPVAGAKRVKYRFVDGKMVEAGVGWASDESGNIKPAAFSASSDSSVLGDWERDQEYYDTGIYGPVPYAHSLFAQETIEEQRRFQNTEPWKLGLPLPLDKKASFLFGPYLRTHAANLVPLARRLIPADCEDLSLFGTSVVETYSGQQHGLHSDREQSDCQPGYGISFWMGLENVSETTTISILPRSGRRYKERCTAHFERGCDVPAGESLRTGPVRDGELIAWTDSTWHESRNTDVHGRAALLVQFNCPSRCSGPIRYPVFVSGKEELGEVWAPDLRVEDLLSERARRPLSSVPAGTFQALDLPWIRNASIVPSVTEVERDWVFLPPPSQPVLSQSVVFDSADLLSTTPAWVADSGSVTCYGTPSLSDQRTSNLQYLTYFRLEWNGAHSIAIEPHPVHVHPSTQICLLTQGSLHYTVGTSLASLTAIDRHAPSIVILPSGTAHTSRHFPGVNATEHCLKLVFRGAPASQLDVRDRPDQHDLEAVHYSLAANWSSQVDPAGFGELLVDRFLIDHPVDGGFVTVKVVNMGQHVRPLVPPDVPRRHLHEVWLVVMNGEVLYEHNNDEITVVTQGQVAFVPAWQWHLFYCEKPCQFVKLEQITDAVLVALAAISLVLKKRSLGDFWLVEGEPPRRFSKTQSNLWSNIYCQFNGTVGGNSESDSESAPQPAQCSFAPEPICYP
eukprot:g37925.t1